MRVGGEPHRTIRPAADAGGFEIIDQTRLPFEFVHIRIDSLEGAAEAIREMRVRGAPLIGVTAAYGLALALRRDPADAALRAACATLMGTRPTAVNLRWALEDVSAAVVEVPLSERAERAWRRAGELADADVETCRAIGEHGLALLEKLQAGRSSGGALQVLTHCNAGWLACVDWGTALAPIYRAHDAGLPVHVWVDETRPRNQGSLLTAWELGQHGVPHTVVADNVGGHLMQRGKVDCCLVGTDRTTASGDVCNKVGTYLKALAARDNGVPFYVAAPSSSIDWTLGAGDQIPIEERDEAEVRRVVGIGAGGRREAVAVVPDASPVSNFAFDVTPARLVSAILTERGACDATPAGLARLFPEHASLR
ncbi:MAG: S-methyl-5-thioribose-1-phosphate isomerase [Myxococcota bacterium]|nr:S-methyl-5-thioribose-1-phosphate isomerase [Myxococcota bacterium]